MRRQQPREWGQNHQRKQIVATATPPGQAYKKKGKSVRKCDFCNIYGFVGWFGGFVFFFFFNKITRLLKNRLLTLCPPALAPPFPLAGHPPYRAELSKEGQTSWGHKWPHSRGRLCPEWEVTPEACLIFKAFKSHFLSIHSKLLHFCLSFLLWAFIFPRSITNYGQATFTAEYTRLGEVHNASTSALTHSGRVEVG